MIHPSLQGILVTPICPRSLSFRPLVLPHDSQVTLILKSKEEEKSSVAEAVASFDGDRFTKKISTDEIITIESSPFLLPTINSYDSDWLRDINNQLMWNQNYQKKPLHKFYNDKELFVKN